MGFRWEGFRRVRRQVCRRIRGRITELGLSGIDAYSIHLDTHPEEWSRLDQYCSMRISDLSRQAKLGRGEIHVSG